MSGVPACGIYDFRYAPYALGDVLTWQTNLLAVACESGASCTEHVIFAFPHRPAPSFQGHVTRHNYKYFLASLFPAFLCSPKLASIQIFNNESTFLLHLEDRRKQGAKSWPRFDDHRRQKLDFISHHQLNSHFRKHGTIPRLAAPLGRDGWARKFRSNELAGRRLIAINPRLSQFSSHETAIFRNSPPAEWRKFLLQAQREHPDVVFLSMGRYEEFPASFFELENVMNLRRLGWGLGEELALLAHSEGFLGASSGFAAFATFSNRPYAIFNMDPAFAPHAGVSAGAKSYPFADDEQRLIWSPETAQSLASECARILS